MEFEWDENKREANLAKHKLDLLDGVYVFDGRNFYTYPSPRDGEERFVSVACVHDVIIALVWIERVNAVRLISLRRARDEEKRAYHARFGQKH